MNVPPASVPQGEQIHVDLDPAATLAAYGRHRRRFAAAVASLDDDALATPSRCHLWSGADVLRHVRDVDDWMQALWSGRPLPFTSFDPIMTPHEFVIAGRSFSDRQARDRFVESSETMAADVGRSGPERWGMTSVSPIGLVPWWLSALHIFFDSWIHERDVLLPLGVTPPVEEEEVLPVLTYSFGIVATLIGEPTDVVLGGVHIVAGRPPVTVTPAVEGVDQQAPEIVDALLGRGAIDEALAGVDPEVAARFAALARIFDPAAT